MDKKSTHTKEKLERFIAKIRLNPELADEFEPIVDIAQAKNSSADFTADQAEEEIRRRIASLAAKTLGGWAQSSAEAAASHALADGAKRHSKKK